MNLTFELNYTQRKYDKEILDYLNEVGSATTKQIASKINIYKDCVTNSLAHLRFHKLIECEKKGVTKIWKIKK